MRHFFLAALTGLTIVTSSMAHFVFVVPAKDGGKAQIIMSDSLAPDENVDIAKIAATKLFVRGVGAADAPISMTKGAHEFTCTVPGRGNRTVFGSVPYGVMQRGDSKPFLLQYHPKAILGDVPGSKPAGDAVPVEIVPTIEAGKLRFQVLARGKPLGDAEVTVMLPGKDESKKVKTDAEGRTPTFEASGRFGAWVKFSENKSGEHGGKKYDEVRHYATLVVDVPVAVKVN